MDDFNTFDYTTAQKDLLKYVKTQFTGVRVRPVGENGLEVIDGKGDTLTLSMNIYGDVMDADTKQIIAKSDLDHDLDRLPMNARPKAWENCPEYFG